MVRGRPKTSIIEKYYKKSDDGTNYYYCQCLRKNVKVLRTDCEDDGDGISAPASTSTDFENLYCNEKNKCRPLHPKTLEIVFANYRFSPNYRQNPTENDLLAVRFANLYRGTAYRLPHIPDDFYDRFFMDLNDEQDTPPLYRCIRCRRFRKTNVFTSCKHLCICEWCSLVMLRCPVCNMEGNSTKINF